jgi:hypothetical protein
VLNAPLVLQMGHPQEENGVKTSSFYYSANINYTEIKDVLAVEDNVGHRETRRDSFGTFLLKKRT